MVDFGACLCCYNCPGLCELSDQEFSLSMIGVRAIDLVTDGDYTFNFKGIDGAGFEAWDVTWTGTFGKTAAISDCMQERDLTYDNDTESNVVCNFTGASVTINPCGTLHEDSDATIKYNFCGVEDYAVFPQGVAPTDWDDNEVAFGVGVTIAGVVDGLGDEEIKCTECDKINGSYFLPFASFVTPAKGPTAGAGAQFAAQCVIPCNTEACIETTGIPVITDKCGNYLTHPKSLMVCIDGAISGINHPLGLTCDCESVNGCYVVDSVYVSPGASRCIWEGYNTNHVCGNGIPIESGYMAGYIKVTKWADTFPYDIEVEIEDNSQAPPTPFGNAIFTGLFNSSSSSNDKNCSETGGWNSTLSLFVDNDPPITPSDDTFICDFRALSVTVSVI